MQCGIAYKNLKYRKMSKHSLIEQGRHSVKDTGIDSVRNQKQNVILVSDNRFD
jgi:hypothetical protein